MAAADNETRTTVRLFDPRRDNWGDQFHVDADQGLIIGITPVGRASRIGGVSTRDAVLYFGIIPDVSMAKTPEREQAIPNFRTRVQSWQWIVLHGFFCELA